MPYYDYKCEHCGHDWEEMQSMKNLDVPLGKRCPECEEKGDVMRFCRSPIIGDPVRLGLIKPPQDFRDRLAQIKKSNPAYSFVKDR